MGPSLYGVFLAAVTFAVPCWVINMSFNFLRPLRRFFSVFQGLNSPLDFGLMLPDGRRLLGDSQGFLSLPVVLLVPPLVYLFVPDSMGILYLKALTVLAGGIAGSFIKRRLGIPRGGFLVGVDHADYMLATCVIFLAFDLVSVPVACLALALTYVFHPLACIAGYYLGIKKEMF